MKITLTELEDAARSLAVKVTYDDLKTSKGGSCRVMEPRRIIINKHLHANEKVAVLARELGRFDLNGVMLAEHILRKIQRESDMHAETLKLAA